MTKFYENMSDALPDIKRVKEIAKFQNKSLMN